MTVKVLCHIFMLVFRTVTSPLRLYASGGHSVSCPMANVHTRASDSYSSFLHASIFFSRILCRCLSVCLLQLLFLPHACLSYSSLCYPKNLLGSSSEPSLVAKIVSLVSRISVSCELSSLPGDSPWP